MSKKGYKMTKEHKEKLSKSHIALGDNHWLHTPQGREKMKQETVSE